PPSAFATPADEPAVASEPELAPPRALPGWLWMVTVACIALFVVGLVMYLRRGGDAQANPTSSDKNPPQATVDAPAHAGAQIDATGPGSDVAPPTGMLLVRHPDGTAWFFVDPQPVTVREYRAVFAKHQQAGREEDPVTMISYNEARSY